MRSLRKLVPFVPALAAVVFANQLGIAQSLVPRGSERPSFDCAKATSSAARLICADGDLANDDNQLADVYKAKAASLDKSGQTALRDEQVKWIRQRNQECGLETKQKASIEELAAAKPCLDKWINERIDALSKPATDHTTTARQQVDSILKLEEGAYVASSVPCNVASAATFLRFEGSKFTGDKMCAEVTGKKDNIVSAKLCGGNDPNAESFQMAGPRVFWRRGIQFRFCEEASLPKEWQKQLVDNATPSKSAKATPDISALKPGTYVEKDTSCKDAPFGRRQVFDGTSITAGHTCPFLVKGKQGAQVEITGKCEGPPDGADQITVILTAISSTAYSIKAKDADAARSNYRYCSQAELDGTSDPIATVTNGPKKDIAPKTSVTSELIAAPVYVDASNCGSCTPGEMQSQIFADMRISNKAGMKGFAFCSFSEDDRIYRVYVRFDDGPAVRSVLTADDKTIAQFLDSVRSFVRGRCLQGIRDRQLVVKNQQHSYVRAAAIPDIFRADVFSNSNSIFAAESATPNGQGQILLNQPGQAAREYAEREAHPAAKKDIRGFTIGGDLSVAVQRNPDCQSETVNTVNLRKFSCNAGTILVSLATALPAQPIMEVSYQFCDVHDGPDIARSVAQQYGLRNFNYTQQFLGSNGQVRLDNRIVLAFSTEMYSRCTNSYGYVLSLKDEQLFQQNVTASEQLRRAAPMQRF